MRTFNSNQGVRGLKEMNINTCMYLEHNIMKDIVGEHFSLPTFMLEVVSKLPDNMCHRLPSPLCKGGLVLLEEGVQIDALHQFEKGIASLKWKIKDFLGRQRKN